MSDKLFLTTAVYEHRDYVPYNYIAIEYARLKFYGYNADQYDKNWKDIVLEMDQSWYEILKKINQNREELKKNQDILDKKPFYKFWDNKQELIARRKVEKLFIEKKMLSDSYVKLKSKYKMQLRCKIEKFLKENGFVFMRRNTKGHECCDYTDFYELYKNI